MNMQQKKVWETPSVSSIGSIEQLTGFVPGMGPPVTSPKFGKGKGKGKGKKPGDWCDFS